MENTEKFEMASSGLLPFDPIVLIQDIAKKWLVILVLALTIGMGTYILTDVSYTPTYQSGTTLVVTSRSASGTVYNNFAFAAFPVAAAWRIRIDAAFYQRM